MKGVLDTAAIAVLSRCSFQGKLFSIFRLLCLVFVRYYLSTRTALENSVLFVIALRSS